MSLLDNISNAMENKLSTDTITFDEDMREDELFALEAAVNHANSEELLDPLDMSDEEIEMLALEVEEDLKHIDDSVEEDPDLREDEDDEALESDLLFIDDDLFAVNESDQDIDEGLDAVNILLEEGFDPL